MSLGFKKIEFYTMNSYYYEYQKNKKESDLLDIIDKGREIEEVYGHFFDKIIRNVDMDRTYKELFETIERVQNEENWVPTSWLTPTTTTTNTNVTKY